MDKLNKLQILCHSMAAAILVATALGHAETQPATPDRPGHGDNASLSDEDFLKSTAGTLGVGEHNNLIDDKILTWDGLRPKLEEKGLTFIGTWTVDYSKPLTGGLDTDGDATRNLLDLRFKLDTKAAFKWEGGTFSIDFQNQAGRNGSSLTGDLQIFDNADADGRTQISELWYEQIFWNQIARIKIGKVDANSEFVFPAYGAGFLNSSFGHPPTITAMPTYPDGSTSFNFFLTPKPWFYAGFGIYDGSASIGIETGAYGPSKLFHSNRSFFYIGQTGVRWLLKDDTLPGHFAVGGFYHDGDFARFDGTTQSGTGGEFLIFEQKLWHRYFYDKTNTDGLYGFLQYGHADQTVSDFADYIGAGLTLIGPYRSIYPDSIGLGMAMTRLSNEPGAGFTQNVETSVELYYNFQPTSYLSLKPDLQYIIHPGGNANVDNALVATMRLILAF